MRLRVSATSASTGVPWMGKKRMRCSGGGSSTMSTICSSSVREERSSRRASETRLIGFWVIALSRAAIRVSSRECYARRSKEQIIAHGDVQTLSDFRLGPRKRPAWFSVVRLRFDVDPKDRTPCGFQIRIFRGSAGRRRSGALFFGSKNRHIDTSKQVLSIDLGKENLFQRMFRLSHR